jgi:PKD repeat protein
VSADESHAPGALTYQISYGDDSTDQNTAPTVCQSGPGQPSSQTWQHSHAYASSGTYTVEVTVQANCTSDRATATLMVTIS